MKKKAWWLPWEDGYQEGSSFCMEGAEGVWGGVAPSQIVLVPGCLAWE